MKTVTTFLVTAGLVLAGLAPGAGASAVKKHCPPGQAKKHNPYCEEHGKRHHTTRKHTTRKHTTRKH